MNTTAGSRLADIARAGLSAAGVARGERLLVALSAGPDSTALASVLARLAPERSLSLVACIVDHGIRPAAEIAEDVACARETCRRIGVPLVVRRLSPGECEAEARREGRSLEEVARRRRLALLADAARESGCGLVALGHTRDDALETILMRALGGAGPAGLAGIRARRGTLVRPLLAARRADVLAWLRAEGLPFRTDSSNADPRFLRNRLRQLLPALDEAVPGWRTGLQSLSRRMRLVSRMLDDAASAMGWQRTARGWQIARGDFFAADPAVRLHALLSLADGLAPGRGGWRLPTRFLAPALGGDPGGRARILARGHGLALACDGERVRWGVDIVTPREKGYLTVVLRDGRYPIGNTGAALEVRFSTEAECCDFAPGARGSAMGTVPGEAGMVSRGVEPPVVIRSRRKGDAISCTAHPEGESSRRDQGSRTLKDLLNAWRVPNGERWRVAVLADRRGVLAVVGDAAGGRTVVRELAGRGGIDLRLVADEAGPGDHGKDMQR